MVSDGGGLVGEGQRVGAEALLRLGLPLRAHACSIAHKRSAVRNSACSAQQSGEWLTVLVATPVVDVEAECHLGRGAGLPGCASDAFWVS